MAEHSAVNRRVVGSSPTCGEFLLITDKATAKGGLNRLGDRQFGELDNSWLLFSAALSCLSTGRLILRASASSDTRVKTSLNLSRWTGKLLKLVVERLDGRHNNSSNRSAG